jgi:hypothetical protein
MPWQIQPVLFLAVSARRAHLAPVHHTLSDRGGLLMTNLVTELRAAVDHWIRVIRNDDPDDFSMDDALAARRRYDAAVMAIARSLPVEPKSERVLPGEITTAVMDLSQAMGNPCVDWSHCEFMATAVIDEATRRLTDEPSPAGTQKASSVTDREGR